MSSGCLIITSCHGHTFPITGPLCRESKQKIQQSLVVSLHKCWQNFMKPLSHECHKTLLMINTCSGNGLVLLHNNPLLDKILNYHQWGLVAFFWGQFHMKWSRFRPLISLKMIAAKSPKSQWVNMKNSAMFGAICHCMKCWNQWNGNHICISCCTMDVYYGVLILAC